jgi:hypothetical protein
MLSYILASERQQSISHQGGFPVVKKIRPTSSALNLTMTMMFGGVSSKRLIRQDDVSAMLAYISASSVHPMFKGLLKRENRLAAF